MLDQDVCYRALTSRDARFDGRFFTAVHTTGVYCRPVCPARTPLRKNVQFFSCAAAAEAEGFRACLRCRPETSPGTPAWLGSSATVSRAMRLIDAGALDDGSVADLAERVGIGDRQLRRLFLGHLGATPLAVASNRRVQIAKKLIDETQLAMTDIAFAAGFSSVRRFNAAIRATYDRSPSDLRRKKRGPEQSAFEIKLTFRPPYDADGVRTFLAARATAGVVEVTDVYRRTARFDETAGIIEVRFFADHLRVRIPNELARHAATITGRVRRLFDLGADPLVIATHLGRDPILKRRLQRRPGVRVPGAWCGFETAIRAILGQQISVKGATTLAGRLANAFGEPLPPHCASESLTVTFPRPGVLATADVQSIGLPTARARTIRTIATEVASGRLELDHTADLDASIRALVALPGIGPWTANYIAMRALQEPDGFPHGDLGLVQSTGLDKRALAIRSERWRPWRAYAAMTLWQEK